MLVDIPFGDATIQEVEKQTDFYRYHGIEAHIGEGIITLVVRRDCDKLVKMKGGKTRCKIYKDRPLICQFYNCKREK